MEVERWRMNDVVELVFMVVRTIGRANALSIRITQLRRTSRIGVGRGTVNESLPKL